MVIVHHLLLENEWAFVYRFFAETIADSLFDYPILSKNVEKNFLIDIMVHNSNRQN